MKKLKQVETSKKILWMTYTLFLGTLLAGIMCVQKDKDTSLFMYAIPSTGGVFAATVAFYLNKAKMENIFKGKEEFLRYKIDLLKDCSTILKSDVEEDLNNMDNVLEDCINTETQEVLSEKFNVTN